VEGATSIERLPGPAVESQLPASATDGAVRDVPAALRLQILTTEHWSLLATRSMSWNESFSRAAMFLSLLSGSIVALALVAQATAFGDNFSLFALLLLPVVLFAGVATFTRLVQVNNEDAHWVVGMNRLRHKYLEIAPDFEAYFVTGAHDDEPGIFKTFAGDPRSNQFLHGFITTPGMIGTIVALVAATLVAVAALRLGAATPLAALAGAVAFFGTVVALAWYAYRTLTGLKDLLPPRFPSAGAEPPPGRS